MDKYVIFINDLKKVIIEIYWGFQKISSLVAKTKLNINCL